MIQGHIVNHLKFFIVAIIFVETNIDQKDFPDSYDEHYLLLPLFRTMVYSHLIIAIFLMLAQILKKFGF